MDVGSKNAVSLSDGQTAAFFRRSETYGDLLIVMNLSPQPIEKDLGKTGKGFSISEKLTANGESIKYKGGVLSLPAYA